MDERITQLERAYRAFDRLAYHFRELSTEDQVRIGEILDSKYKWPKNVLKETILKGETNE
jgi:hypothetical protein